MPTNSDLNPGSPGGVQGSSQIYKFGTSPNTRAVVSQRVRVLTPAYGGTGLLQMGVLSSFGINDGRGVEAISGIGFGDQVAELVPGMSDPMTASIERALLYLSNMWQATGYAAGVSGPVRALKHHRWPFDIEQQIVFSRIADAELSGDGTGSETGFSASTGSYGSLAYQGALGGGGEYGSGGSLSHNILISYYEACWWTSWSATFAKDSVVVMESGDVTITDVHDFGTTQYGEFLATGNDPTIGQTGSLVYNNDLTQGAG